MTRKNLTNARAEAKKFLRAAQKMETRYETEPASTFLPVCRESGAVRRASMDLTRALADLRKP